jgi:hypothetical protein
VLCRHDGKDVVRIASSRDSLVQLDMRCTGPLATTAIAAHGWAQLLLAPALYTWQRSVLIRCPIGSRTFSAVAMATLPIAPWLRLALPIVTSVRADSRIAMVMLSVTIGLLHRRIASSVGLAASAPIRM